MAEPTSTSVVAGAGAGAATSLPFLLLGASWDALLVGLISAVLVSVWLPRIDDRLKSFSAVIMSSLVAGYGSPAAAGVLHNFLPSAGLPETTRLFMALAIGGAAPALIPTVIDRARDMISGWRK